MTFHVSVGDHAQFTKTVGEYDVLGFAGITGDLAPNHVDEHMMRDTPYGGRIAHGALVVGYMSTTSTMICQNAEAKAKGPQDEIPVSLGYDRIRFLKGVRIGDTLTVHYTIAEVDPEQRRSRSEIRVTNQDGDTVAVAQHILKWVKKA
ncbi:MaoC family dehydratase [Castellaniella sp. S9]|uniref:MaoC family dehydratase n=1 Tax=Castellaniella sp. S9 TaxID=2993652 RepID=UPI0022B5C731|nr:MaoC/PaaZ C-terminal domain-containing protein [Castellaniella sp. S9]